MLRPCLQAALCVLTASLAGCDGLVGAQVDAAAPQPPACDGVQDTASFVESTLFGPASATGTTVTVPIAPTVGGELLVVTITSTNGSYGWVHMAGGQSMFQVQASQGECGRYVEIFSIGNVQAGVSSFTIDTDYRESSAKFTGLVTRFTGLAPDSGARFSYDYGDPTAACPGTVLASAAVSCGDVSLPPESPFIARDVGAGVAAAYYIPSEAGRYVPDWQATDSVRSEIVSLE